jgi:hypothetical protein
VFFAFRRNRRAVLAPASFEDGTVTRARLRVPRRGSIPRRGTPRRHAGEGFLESISIGATSGHALAHRFSGARVARYSP